EVALALDCDRTLAPGLCFGTLARAPLAGVAARELLENVAQADWSADGSGLAVVRVGPETVTLEYPVGHVLVQTRGHGTFPRLSPRGDCGGFMEHPFGPDVRGFGGVVDLQGPPATCASRTSTVKAACCPPAIPTGAASSPFLRASRGSGSSAGATGRSSGTCRRTGRRSCSTRRGWPRGRITRSASGAPTIRWCARSARASPSGSRPTASGPSAPCPLP